MRNFSNPANSTTLSWSNVEDVRREKKNWYPKISVVTPNYNGNAYLEETIHSVLSQGYPNLEYIVIDGGSSDSSIDIIKKYEPWLTHWVSEKDSGQSEAINKGLKLATGEIFAWLNSDDIYYPSTLFAVARRFGQYKKRKNFAGIYGRCKVIDENSFSSREHASSPSDFNLENLLLRDFVPQPSAFWDTQVIKNLGGLNEEFHYSLDYELLIRLAQRYKMIRVPEYFSGFRIVKGTKSISYPERFFIENKRILDTLGKDGVTKAAPQRAYAFFYWNYGYFKFCSGDFEFARIMFARAFLSYNLLDHDRRMVFERFIYQANGLRDLDSIKLLLKAMPNEIRSRSFTKELLCRQKIAQVRMILISGNMRSVFSKLFLP